IKIALTLLLACSLGQTSFAMHGNPNITQQFDQSSCACARQSASLFEASHWYSCLYHCALFLTQGANPNELTFTSEFGTCLETTPLQRPCHYGRKEIVSLLLDHGA